MGWIYLVLGIIGGIIICDSIGSLFGKEMDLYPVGFALGFAFIFPLVMWIRHIIRNQHF